jgi:hypothetical protein
MDVVALDFFADGRHIVIDAVMTTMYIETLYIIRSKRFKDMQRSRQKTRKSWLIGSPHNR